MWGNETTSDMVRGQFLASKGKPQLKMSADMGLGQGIYALPSFRDRIEPEANGEAAHKAVFVTRNTAIYRQIRSQGGLSLLLGRLSTAPYSPFDGSPPINMVS